MGVFVNYSHNKSESGLSKFLIGNSCVFLRSAYLNMVSLGVGNLSLFEYLYILLRIGF